MNLRALMAFLAAAAVVAGVRNSERMAISLGDSNEVGEMIRDSSHPTDKLKRFDDFVKGSRGIKRPWEKLFIKSIEYRKSEESYRKMIRDVINKMAEFNRERAPNLVHLSVPYGRDPSDDDDDDDEDMQSAVPSPDQSELRRRYQAEVARLSNVYKYSDRGKPEESVREALQKIFDLRVPEDCTNVTGFGLASVECIVKNCWTKDMTVGEAVGSFARILLVWTVIYVCIAVPLWCITGWGCCCVTWKYCRPERIVEEVERYIAENPPGVHVNEEGEEEHYAPSLRERELYERMSRRICQV